MRRTALTLAGLFAAVAAALSSCGRNTTVLTGPSNLVTVKVVAPSTMAPGSTAQFSSVATYSDGSSKDVTATVQWRSSDTSILTISTTGLASGVHAGDAGRCFLSVATSPADLTLHIVQPFILSNSPTNGRSAAHP